MGPSVSTRSPTGFANRAKGVLVLTGLGSGEAQGEVLRSKMDSIPLKEFVFAPNEEKFMDATCTSLRSPGQAWSAHAYFVDRAQSHPTGDEALILRIQAVPKKFMFRGSNNPQVEVKSLFLGGSSCMVKMRPNLPLHGTAKK